MFHPLPHPFINIHPHFPSYHSIIFFLQLSTEMNNNQDEYVTRKLYELYRDPESRLFLQTDTEKIYQAAKNDAKIHPVTRKEIHDFKSSIESASRDFETRTLRSRQRHITHRQWLSFSPLSILLGMAGENERARKPARCLSRATVPSPGICYRKVLLYHVTHVFSISVKLTFQALSSPPGDLCFLPSIRKKNGGRFVILILMDCFSRLCHLTLLRNGTSTEVLKGFEKGLAFFGASKFQTYTHFGCDRG